MATSLRLLAEAVRAAWAWWIAEIYDLLDAAFGYKIGARRRLPVARLRPDGECELFAVDGSGPTPSERFAAIGSPSGVAVELPLEWVLRQRVDLPLAAVSRARDAIGFMIDRLSPFPRDQVFFGIQVAGLDRENRTARVEVAITPRARISLTLARLAENGLTTVRVEAGAPELARPFLFEDAVEVRKVQRDYRLGRIHFEPSLSAK
jgi:hypothetical protein